MVFGCGGDWLNFFRITHHKSSPSSIKGRERKTDLRTPPPNQPKLISEGPCLLLKEAKLFQTFVLPMLSCKLVTPELICEKNHSWHLEEGKIVPHDFHICRELSRVAVHKASLNAPISWLSYNGGPQSCSYPAPHCTVLNGGQSYAQVSRSCDWIHFKSLSSFTLIE